MADRITFKKMLELVENETGLNTTESDRLLRRWFDIINEGLERDGRVRISKFGTFKLKGVKERNGINLRTRESIKIPAHTKVVFNGAKKLKDTVNLKYNLLEAKPIVMNEEKKSDKKVTKKDTVKKDSIKKESGTEIDDLISQIKETPEDDKNKLKYEETPTPVKEETKIEQIKKKKSEELRAKIEDKFSKKENDFTPPGVQTVSDEKPKETIKPVKEEPKKEPVKEEEKIEKVEPISSEKVEVVVQKEPEKKEPESPVIVPKKEEKKKNRLGLYIVIAALVIILLIIILFWKPWSQAEEVILEDPVVKEVVKTEPPKPVVSKKVYKTPGGEKAVAVGDNLWDMSDEFYKDHYLWPNIYRVNDAAIPNPDILIVGNVVTVPPLEGTFRNLTAIDSVNISVGFYKAYKAYKRYGNQWAKYYLWVCKKYDEKTFNENRKNVDQEDAQFAISMK